MKKLNRILFSILLIFALVFSICACKPDEAGQGGGNQGDGTSEFGSRYDTITVTEALELAKKHTTTSSPE